MGATPTPQPLLSVLLFTYNGEKFIEEAVASVLNQTYTFFEFRIVDDGSSDKTVEILERFAARDRRIILLKNSQNMGTGYSYSKALNGSLGLYIAQIGQDDRWHPGFLATVAAYLDNNSKCAAVFTDVRIVDTGGNENAKIKPFQFEYFATKNQEQLVSLFLKHNFVCTAASLFRRSAVQGWHSLGNNDQLQDWNTWLKVLLTGEIHFINQQLADYRVHSANLSIRGASEALRETEILHSRMQFLMADEFWNYVKAQREPNRFLNQIVQTYFEVMNPEKEDHWQALFYAFRSHEHEFPELPVMKTVLGLMFWRLGAYSKARRYLDAETADPFFERLPPRIQKLFKCRMYFGIAPKIKPQNSQWCRQSKLGPLLVLNVRNFSHCAFKPPGLFLDLTTTSLDRLLERIHLRRNLFIRIAGRFRRLIKGFP